MKKAIEIEITRAEGRTVDCYKMVLREENGKTVMVRYSPDGKICENSLVCLPVWKATNRILFQWSETAPKKGGYDKCDYCVKFEDNETFSGRYDLKHWTIEMPNLHKHIRSHFEFFAGLRCPSHLSQLDYEKIVNDFGHKEEAKMFLQDYEILA